MWIHTVWIYTVNPHSVDLLRRTQTRIHSVAAAGANVFADQKEQAAKQRVKCANAANLVIAAAVGKSENLILLFDSFEGFLPPGAVQSLNASQRMGSEAILNALEKPESSQNLVIVL